MSVTRAVDRVLDWVLPRCCLGCNESLPGRTPTPLGLCSTCLGRLVPHPEPGRGACPRCAQPRHVAPSDAKLNCPSCRRRPPAFDRLHVGWRYAPPLTAVVEALKFHRLDYLGPQVGARLAAAVDDRLPEVDMVVPVPLHWWRHLRRGYNQAEAIGRRVADHLDVPCRRRLARSRSTPAQSGLSRRRRRRNLRGAFRCRRRLDGERVLLVDDVVTTGATLEAAARCLLEAGSGTVTALAAARTPGADELTPLSARA